MVKKRILLFSDYFLPGFRAGGPIKSLLNLSIALENSYEVLVLTRNHDFGDHNFYSDVLFNKVTNLCGFKVIYLNRITINRVYMFIKSFNPHIVHLNSYFSLFTIIVLILRKVEFIKCQIVLSPRGELLPNALEINYLKKKVFIKFSSLIKLYNGISFHCTSHVEVFAVNQYHQNIIYKIDNLASVNNRSISHVIEPLKPLRIVFISRIRENKNLLFSLEVLQNISDRDIIFDIFGPIEDVKYWATCLKAINNLPITIKCNYRGIVNSADVKSIMLNYQVFFLPSKTENFGHVIVEAMQVGLIPLISTETPWNDLQESNAGWAIDLTKKEEYIKVIKLIYDYDERNIQNLSENVIKYVELKLNNSQTIENYCDMYNTLIK